MTFIFGAVVFRVSNEIRLPVVVEISVADRNIIRGMGDVYQTVVVVLVVGKVRGDVAVIDPDVSRGLNSDRIAVFGKDFGDA